MANVNDPNGFTPAYHISGGTIRPSEFAIQSGATGDIFSGDVVKLSSGYVLQGGATDAPLGVFYGVQYTATDGQLPVLVQKMVKHDCYFRFCRCESVCIQRP